MNTPTVTTHPMPVAQLSVPAAFASVEVYRARRADSSFAAFCVASVGVDAAAHASDVWGIPCTPLVGSICMDAMKRRNTKANVKPATTSMAWLLRPSGVQGDPPV